jgi:hypothetical protein
MDPIAPSKIKDARAVVTSELAKLDINLFADVESDGSGAHNLPRLPVPSSGTWPPLERTHPFWNQLLHPGIQTLTQQQLFDLATNIEVQQEIRNTVALHPCPIQTAFPELHTRTATAHPAALATLFFSSPSLAPAAGSVFSERGTIKLIIVADYFQQGIRSVPHMVQRGWIVSYQDLRDWVKAEGVQGEFTIFRVDDVESGFEGQRKRTVDETGWRRAVVVEERLLIVEKSVLELGEKQVESREAV